MKTMTRQTEQETFAVAVSKTVQYQITADSREDAEHIAEQIKEIGEYGEEVEA